MSSNISTKMETENNSSDEEFDGKWNGKRYKKYHNKQKCNKIYQSCWIEWKIILKAVYVEQSWLQCHFFSYFEDQSSKIHKLWDWYHKITGRSNSNHNCCILLKPKFALVR